MKTIAVALSRFNPIKSWFIRILYYFMPLLLNHKIDPGKGNKG